MCFFIILKKIDVKIFLNKGGMVRANACKPGTVFDVLCFSVVTVIAAFCPRLPKYGNLLKSFIQAFYMRSPWGMVFLLAN